MMGRASKNTWALILLMLAGVVIGGFIGDYAGNLPYLAWLKYGRDFGLLQPLALDLGILSIHFGFTIRFTICGILGILLAIFIYKKWA